MNIKLLDVKLLKNFSSGNSIESFNEHLYVFGSDARQILVTNRNWKIQETINLFPSETSTIENDSTKYFQPTAIGMISRIPLVLMIGPDAVGAVNNNKALLMNLQSRAIEEIDLTLFYARLKESGFEDLAIHTITLLNDKVILCSRADRTNPVNRVIITSPDFYTNQQLADILILRMEIEEKPGQFLAINGLTYSYKNDWLIASLKSEELDAANESGSFGDAYIGVIENVSRKIGRKRLKINQYLNLSAADKKLKGRDIQGLCIPADKEKRLKIHLTGKNNKQESTLFKVRLKE